MTGTFSYEPFEKLIASLGKDGLLKESSLLHNMIHQIAWTTGSELMGELGQTLKRITKENLPRLSDDSREHIREAMEMGRRVWPDFKK
jgi:hypothetical protein